ncbi:ALF repeat-containing protein [Streptomyces sp. NPDC047049]|uniref:ALF repeat-containing protein n=1 Tax=Streptomyces sp. NPDC047049 TaxID=3156688 RepID=UPI0033E1992C
MTDDLPVLEEHDLRIQAAQVMAMGGPGVREAANKALDGGIQELQAFLDGRFVQPYDTICLSRWRRSWPSAGGA